MAQRLFEFRPPAWRAPTQLNLRIGALLVGTALWIAGYLWLAAHLFRQGAVWPDRTGWTVIWMAIVTGVVLVLAWRATWPRWRVHWRQGHRHARNLDELFALSPGEFEAYVAQQLFARHGYQVHNTRDVKDGGVDILVTDPTGRRAIVQCKRYRGTVGTATVRDLYGTMIHQEATMAFLVTTGAISVAARDWVAGKPIRLIDGQELLQLLHTEAETR